MSRPRHDHVHRRARRGAGQGGVPRPPGRPHDHTTAAIAVALHEASQPGFRDYVYQVVGNARAVAAALTERGYDLVSGGTDNHLILVHLVRQGIGGKPAARALDRAGGDGMGPARPWVCTWRATSSATSSP